MRAHVYDGVSAKGKNSVDFFFFLVCSNGNRAPNALKQNLFSSSSAVTGMDKNACVTVTHWAKISASLCTFFASFMHYSAYWETLQYGQSIPVHCPHSWECSARYHKGLRLHKFLPQKSDDPPFQLCLMPLTKLSVNKCRLLIYIFCSVISSITVIYISSLFDGVKHCDHALGSGRFYAL